jgi:hypothetical protein
MRQLLNVPLPLLIIYDTSEGILVDLKATELPHEDYPSILTTIKLLNMMHSRVILVLAKVGQPSNKPMKLIKRRKVRRSGRPTQFAKRLMGAMSTCI